MPGSIAVDSSSVYWTTIDGVLKVPLDGGTPVALVANASPSGLLLDAGNLYWINDADSSAGGSILKMPVAGGTPVTLASAQLTLNSLSVDATSVYWTNEGTISEITDDGLRLRRWHLAEAHPEVAGRSRPSHAPRGRAACPTHDAEG